MKTKFYVGLDKNDNYTFTFNVDAPSSIENKGTSIYYDLPYLLDNDLLEVWDYFERGIPLSDELIKFFRDYEDVLFLDVEYVRYLFKGGEWHKEIYTIESNHGSNAYDKLIPMIDKAIKKARKDGK